MREPLKDINRLEHIVTSINYINEFMDGITYDELKKNKLVYFAVIKNIEIIGEAAYMLSHEFIDSHPETPWKLIKGMRHYIVHGYYQVNAKVVWDVTHDDLQTLYSQVKGYIKELEGE